MRRSITDAGVAEDLGLLLMAVYPPSHHIITSLAIDVRRTPTSLDGRCLVDLHPVRPSLGSLVPVVDMVGGSVASRHAAGDWMATSNLWISERAPIAPDGGPIEISNRLLRAGKRLIVVACEVSQGDRPVATSTVEFARIRREASRHDIPAANDDGAWRRFGNGPVLDRPLEEACGIEVVDAGRGIARLPHGPFVSNSIGTIQGGAAALLADVGACAMVGSNARVVDLAFRFLAQTGEGPAETRGEIVRRYGGGAVVRVEVVDAADGALVGWAMVAVEA
ncbi:MAG: hypothetical protein R2733_19420 [Acidimicrobiales bacterium]